MITNHSLEGDDAVSYIDDNGTTEEQVIAADEIIEEEETEEQEEEYIEWAHSLPEDWFPMF